MRMLHDMRWWCLPLLASLILWPAGGRAETAADPVAPPVAQSSNEDDAWIRQSVHDLLQHDLQEALQRQSGKENGASPVTAGRQPPRLAALYGVGAALMAEIHVGSKAYLYVRGQPWPIGHSADRDLYRLLGMNGACVQLEKGGEQHSLCLHLLLGEARP